MAYSRDAFPRDQRERLETETIDRDWRQKLETETGEKDQRKQGVYSGVETVVNGPPIGQHTFSSDLIGQRMPPVPVST